MLYEVITLKLFEFGKTYHDFNGNREEHKHLTLFASGNQNSDTWVYSNKKSDFFYMKGIIYSILERLGINRVQESPIENDIFSEGIEIGLGKMKLVEFGLIKKPILKHFDISQEVVFADFNWESILDIIKRNKITFKAIAKYPEVRRDFALLLDDSVSFKDIYSIANRTERQLRITSYNVCYTKLLRRSSTQKDKPFKKLKGFFCICI